MKVGTVFIAQEPMWKNLQGQWISKGLDIASASEYGTTIIVWPPGTSIMTRELIEEEALQIADVYDQRTDYVIALGSPTLISLLAWAIGARGKQLRVLEWDNRLLKYYPTLGATRKEKIEAANATTERDSSIS